VAVARTTRPPPAPALAPAPAICSRHQLCSLSLPLSASLCLSLPLSVCLLQSAVAGCRLHDDDSYAPVAVSSPALHSACSFSFLLGVVYSVTIGLWAVQLTLSSIRRD
jgi:hypothetical protein